MKRLITLGIGFVLGLAGIILMFLVSWKLALGVFLFVWGNNIQIEDRLKKIIYK